MSLTENSGTLRRLAAILAADAVGYSRLMGEDEEGTLARLKTHRRELVDPKIADHHGRIVKTTGDGLLAEFASVVDAVRCAVEVQRAMAERETNLPQDRRIRFRIGVNLGDIIADGDDIFGDGVNVAARLEGLAEPGGICVSGTVRDHIGDRLLYQFEDIGERSVKNIARPVSVFSLPAAAVAMTPFVPVQAQPSTISAQNSLRPAVIAACFLAMLAVGIGFWWAWPRSYPAPTISLPPVPGAPAKPAPRLSIVVLPFANLSSDPEQEYFVDAITDDLTTDLSRIVNSFVIARTTAFTYKGKPIDVKQIGRDLGVRYVLEGSVRHLGEEIQVNVQLIDAESGAHVWADRFNTDRANLSKAQEEITSRLARTLDIALVQAAVRQTDRERNPDARDLIMRGWALYHQSVSHRPEAKREFEKALELDPQSIGARASIARLLAEGVGQGVSKSPDEDLRRAEKLSLEAIERDPRSAPAYYALGVAHRLQNRLAEARVELEKVITFDRNHGQAIQQLGITLLQSGEPEAALPHFEQALRLSPGFAGIHFYYFWLGFDHLLMNHSDRAIDYFRKACAAAPQNGGYRMALAAALGLKGDIEESKAALAEALKLWPQVNSIKKQRNRPNFKTGNAKYHRLIEQTWEVGMRFAGMPEE